MAIAFQYNKTSLQSLEKNLKMRVRALPTLKNKESALRLEVKKAKDEILKLDKEVEQRIAAYDQMLALWGEFDTTLLRVDDVKMSVKDINNNVLMNINKPQPLPMAQMKGHPLFAKLFDLIKGMKPGSKMIAVIPGDLLQTEMMGMSPNMTLICEVTTVGLHKEEPRPAPQAYPGRPRPGSGPKPAPAQPKPQPRASK